MKTNEEVKEIRKGQTRWLRKIAKKRRKENEAILNETMRLLKKPGASIETVYPVICDRFNCTKRRIDSIFKRAGGLESPGAQAHSEAQMIVYLQNVAKEIGYQVEDFVRQLDEIDVAGAEGHEFVKIELVETEGDKTSKTIKSVALDVARNSVKKQLLDALARYPELIGKLKGQTNILNQQNFFSEDTMQDVAHRIKVMEGQHGIRGGVSEDTGRPEDQTYTT